ncbi:MAG TPA: radical SAM protein [Geomonas sp.]|nr:radical SAM protein [Geomonas sp.]
MEAAIERLAVAEAADMSRADIMNLLLAKGELQQGLFEMARQVRQEAGQADVVLRGVIEISNACHRSCDYCAMRGPNNELNRYTMTADQILKLAEKIKESGIGICFLQAGQNSWNDALIAEVIPVIKHEIGLDVMLCLGERRQEVYDKWVELGASAYILKFETSDATLFNKITHSQLDNRLQCLDRLRKAGMKFGTGNIVGIPGQSMESLVDDILLGLKIGPDFISTSPFIPNSNTPLEKFPKGSADMTLNTMAILRILLKNPLIPSVSALETVYPEGQTVGLNAGANVLTINFTPKNNQEMYKIYSEQRFVVSLDHALRAIERAGLKVRQGGH